MLIKILDKAAMGDDTPFSPLYELGDVVIYDKTAPEDIKERISDAEVVIVNKVKLSESVLTSATSLRLICTFATGYDNIDVEYCKREGIAVCNVPAYSTQSVSLMTVSTVLALQTKLYEYSSYVASGEYTDSGVANKLTPVYHEIAGKTWGIVGYGNIGKQVARVAEALGCNILVYKRTPVVGVECVDFDTICQKSNILSLHVPLNEETKNLLDKKHIAMLKKGAIVVNVARGAVADEAALAEAILEKKIGGLGIDVYSKEPFDEDHPFNQIKHLPNVLLTPHMAWGGYETRVRLLAEIKENIIAFYNGKSRCRVD